MSDAPRKLECEEAIRIVLEYLDNELSRHDHEAMEAHLSTCRSCFSRMEFEKRLKGKIGDMESQKAPATLRDRITKISGKF
jgi:anti-sigma factor (TIGR02949 family)